MSSKAVAICLSAEEFAERHNGDHFELVKGVVREVPPGGLEHGMICAHLAALLFTHVEAHDLGHVMSNDSFVKTGPESMRGADVLFYSYERLPKGQPVPKGFHNLAPDLTVEVMLPMDRWIDTFTKVVEYLQADVRIVLLLDPKSASVAVYRPDHLPSILHNGDELTIPEILPGFSVPVSQLFA